MRKSILCLGLILVMLVSSFGTISVFSANATAGKYGFVTI